LLVAVEVVLVLVHLMVQVVVALVDIETLLLNH